MNRIIFVLLFLVGCSGETINKLDIVDTTTGTDVGVVDADVAVMADSATLDVEDIAIFDSGNDSVVVVDVGNDTNVSDTNVNDVSVREADSGKDVLPVGHWLITADGNFGYTEFGYPPNDYGFKGTVTGNSPTGQFNAYVNSGGTGKYCVSAKQNSVLNWWYSIDIIFSYSVDRTLGYDTNIWKSVTPKLSGKLVNSTARMYINKVDFMYIRNESTCEKKLPTGFSSDLNLSNPARLCYDTYKCHFFGIAHESLPCSDGSLSISNPMLQHSRTVYRYIRFAIESDMKSTDAGDSYLCLEDLVFNKE